MSNTDINGNAELELAARRLLASGQRGMGPPRQSEPLDHHKVLDLVITKEPLFRGGPLNSKTVHVIATMFLNRELEVSLAERGHITINEQDITTSFLLPVSKHDPEARGRSRTWPCV